MDQPQQPLSSHSYGHLSASLLQHQHQHHQHPHDEAEQYWQAKLEAVVGYAKAQEADAQRLQEVRHGFAG